MTAIGRRALTFVLLGAGVICAAWWFSPARAPDYFEDMTAKSGLDFTHRTGEEADHFTILESLGGGVGLIDYDRDGLLDIFVTGGGHFSRDKAVLGYPNRLFRNEGNWRFRDVTLEVGLPIEGLFYSHGCAVGDYNNDGWPDLLVTGYGRMSLYRNDRGKFLDVTRSAGLLDERTIHWSTSAAWGDINGDGHLDLFVGHYVHWTLADQHVCAPSYSVQPRDNCPPDHFKPLAQALYLNKGNGTFKEITSEAGLLPAKVLGVLILDTNNDGKLDIYLANDGLGKGNFLFLNQGNGRFEEAAAVCGVAYSKDGNSNGSMGIAAADYNRSGFASLLVTNFQDQDHTLYRNLGNGYFQNSEYESRLTDLGRAYVGWGTGFFDLDLDGSEDLFIANGHVLRYPKPPATVKQRPALLRNLYQPGDKYRATRFEIVTERAGAYFRTDHMGRGVALGDLDNDGGIDLVISHTNEPVTLLRNRAASGGRWLGVSLVGKGCRDAVGAKLSLEVGGQTLSRFIFGGGSYLSSGDQRVIFGLGNANNVQKLTVRWPSGQVQTLSAKDLTVSSYTTLIEP